MPIVIRVRRRTLVTGLITLLFAAKDSACLKPDMFSLSVRPALGTQVNSGGAHQASYGQNSRYLEKCSFEDLQAILLKSSLVRAIADAMEGRHVPFLEGLLLGSALSRISPHGLCNVQMAPIPSKLCS